MEQPDTTVQDSAVANQAAPEPVAQPEPEIDEALLDEVEQQAAVDDEVEDDLDGVKVRGKKDAVEKLKAERLMQADYTRKRQASIAEVEAERQSIAREKAEVAARGQLYQAHLNVVADLVAADKQIAMFKNVDWNALTDSDPVQAVKLDRQYRTLVESRQQGLQQLSALQQQHAFEEQRRQAQAAEADAKRIEQAAEVLSREVPNWSKRDVELREYAVKQGVNPAVLRDIVVQAPQLGKVFHKAELYDQLIAKQTARAKPEAQAEPVTRIASTRAVANKDPSQMTDSEFAAWRKRQISQRR